jgi:hypothetical protein
VRCGQQHGILVDRGVQRCDVRGGHSLIGQGRRIRDSQRVNVPATRRDHGVAQAQNVTEFEARFRLQVRVLVLACKRMKITNFRSPGRVIGPAIYVILRKGAPDKPLRDSP